MDEEKQPLTYHVSAAEGGQRLDKSLVKLGKMSRSQIAKLIEDGLVSINGKAAKASALLKIDDVIKVSPRTIPDLVITSLAVPILYEDDALIVVNKPSGIVVHSEPQAPQANLVDVLKMQSKTLAKAPADHPKREGVVHRLDKDTTGVLIFAKTDAALKILQQQFKEKSGKRVYLAILDGLLKKPVIEIESYLSRNPQDRRKFLSKNDLNEGSGVKQRYAKSIFRLKSVYGHRYSLVEIELRTGRTHQIRVHAEALGAGVLGDPLYGAAKSGKSAVPTHFDEALRKLIFGLKRQMLHAQELSIVHPVLGSVFSFSAPPPEDMTQLLEKLKSYECE